MTWASESVFSDWTVIVKSIILGFSVLPIFWESYYQLSEQEVHALPSWLVEMLCIIQTNTFGEIRTWKMFNYKLLENCGGSVKYFYRKVWACKETDSGSQIAVLTLVVYESLHYQSETSQNPKKTFSLMHIL